MVDLSHCNRVWMITDTHFGVRNSLEEWIDIHRSYFFDEFIPLVKKEYRPGDVLFHVGDVFDSRHALTLKVLNMAIDIFEELGKIFEDGIYVIAGNHDCFYKSTTEVNSLRVLNTLPNVNVYSEPETLMVGGSKFLMMPWRKDHDADLEAIRQHANGHDYLICHMDVYGMRGSRFNVIETGTEVKAFSVFKTVYSGHIHYAQKLSNVTMLGTPYELTRSDMYNEKAVVLLDVNSGKETRFPNRTSPKFMSISMTDMLELPVSEINKMFSNNFVDVYIDNVNFMSIPVNTILDMIGFCYRSISFIPPNISNASSLNLDNEKDIKDFNIKDTIDTYCKSTLYDDETKKKLKNSLYMLYEKATESV